MTDDDAPILELFLLTDKVAVITGAVSGLGAGFAGAPAQATARAPCA